MRALPYILKLHAFLLSYKLFHTDIIGFDSAHGEC